MTGRDVRSPNLSPGFTLLELLVSMGALTLLVVVFAGLVQQTSGVWRRTTGKVEQFRGSRDAFEAMTTRLAQATLNTRWDNDNPSAPTRYERSSDLRFISGPASDLLGEPPEGRARPTHAVFFQAPLGVTDVSTAEGFENLLCTWGYYVEFADDLGGRPSFVTAEIAAPRYRSRLMELRQPAEQNTIYQYTSGLDSFGRPLGRSYRGKEWFRDPVNSANAPAQILAENVIALLLTPRLSLADETEITGRTGAQDASPLAPGYLYDSAPPAVGTTDARYRDGRLNPVHQLPPLLQVTMVTIDEASAVRLNFSRGTPDFFGLAAHFRQSADYSQELLRSGAADSLENRLIAQHINYRIFTTNVQLRGSKWSRTQTD
jgi:uncharacterized protein (TIGR02599 family)